jgi:hypothetical protein
MIYLKLIGIVIISCIIGFGLAYYYAYRILPLFKHLYNSKYSSGYQRQNPKYKINKPNIMIKCHHCLKRWVCSIVTFSNGQLGNHNKHCKANCETKNYNRNLKGFIHADTISHDKTDNNPN